jgi:hypothetical protein
LESIAVQTFINDLAFIVLEYFSSQP